MLFEDEKPEPAIVTETVELTVPDAGVIEVTVAAVALLTVKALVSVATPPSLFTTTRYQVPGVAPLRGKEVVICVDETTTVFDPLILVCPDIPSLAVARLAKPVPVIVISLTYPLLNPLEGETLEIVGVDTAKERVPETVLVVLSTTFTF